MVDFNTILYEFEKVGGAPASQSSCVTFSSCLDNCNLVDFGYKGPSFAWSRGDLRGWLDLMVCNPVWKTIFPSSSLVNIPLPSLDHCALWLRLDQANHSLCKHDYFKFFGPWLEHPVFKVKLDNAWRQTSSWNENISRLTKNLRSWNKDVFGNIFNWTKEF